MNKHRLKKAIERAAAEIPGMERVAEIDTDSGDIVFELTYADVIPGEEGSPWTMICMLDEEWEHAIFDETGTAIEFAQPFQRFDPEDDGYLDRVRGISLPFVDFQRMVPGVSARWSPANGTYRIGALILCEEHDDAQLEGTIVNRIRGMMALTYLVRYKFWEMQLGNALPDEMAAPIKAKVRETMFQALGVCTDSSRAGTEENAESQGFRTFAPNQPRAQA